MGSSRGLRSQAVRRTEAKRSPEQPDPHAEETAVVGAGDAEPLPVPAFRVGHAQSGGIAGTTAHGIYFVETRIRGI
jgi:hypothetical protein